MKKTLLILVLGAMLLGLGSCGDKKAGNVAVNSAASDSLKAIITQKDTEINDMMGTLNDIQEGFRQINEAENRVNIAKDGEGVNKKQQLKENIKFIADAMKRN